MPCARIVRSDAASQPSLAAGEPHQPALDQEVRARLGLELAPERAGAARRGGVDRVGAVAAADQPRLAAGGRARVAGLELVDERDVLALAREPPGKRGAERPGADDHHGVHAAADATVPRVLAAARRARAPVRPLRRATARCARRGVRRQGPVKVLVRRARSTATSRRGARWSGGCGARRRRRACSCGWSTPSTPTACGAARARTCAGSTSTATSPAAGAAAGAPFDSYYPGRARVLRARVARAAAARAADPAGRHDPVPPAPAAREPHRRRRRAHRARATPAASGCPRGRSRAARHRHGLAEHHVPGDERVRGRAARPGR